MAIWRILFLSFVLGLGLFALTSAEPLPEGNNGIAARYPGDVDVATASFGAPSPPIVL